MTIELIIALVIFVFIIVYRTKQGESLYTFVVNQTSNIYNKYAPYSFKVVREKVKELGQEYTPKQYMIQLSIFTKWMMFV